MYCILYTIYIYFTQDLQPVSSTDDSLFPPTSKTENVIAPNDIDMNLINNPQSPGTAEGQEASLPCDQSNNLAPLLIVQDVEKFSQAPIADLLNLSREYTIQIDNYVISLEKKQN